MKDENYKFVINLNHKEILVINTEEYVEHAFFLYKKKASHSQFPSQVIHITTDSMEYTL